MRKILNGQGTLQQEQILLAIGALLILVHSVDDSIALGEVDMAPAIINAIAFVIAAVYRWLPWFIFVPLALFVGITRLIGGVLHFVTLLSGDPQPGDWTGIFEAAGAAVFLAMVAVVLRRRFGTADQPSGSATGESSKDVV